MGTMTILRSRYPRLTRRLKRPTDLLGRIGDHMLFYLRALGGVPHAAIHFRREIIRLIAEISMGAGTLAMIGGTVVIVGFLTLAAGGTLAVLPIERDGSLESQNASSSTSSGSARLKKRRRCDSADSSWKKRRSAS